MADLTGLTHYPEGYGIAAAHGAIDMGYRWKAGIVRRMTREGGTRPWVSVDGDAEFPTGGQWRNVQVSVWTLAGLPIQEIDPFAWPPVPGAKHFYG